MLTARANDLLAFIEHYMDEHNLAPTRREMATALGLKSFGRINMLIEQLVERGHIKTIPHRARAIELVTSAPRLCARCGERLDADHVRVTDKQVAA